MALIEDVWDNQKLLCSVDSSIVSYATMVCRTDRKVNVYWINYEGNLVRYHTLDGIGDVYEIQTFVTHPWVFKDAGTGCTLYCNGNEVFFPPPFSEDNPVNVLNITIPVYPLREFCLQKVQQIYTEDEVQEFSLPQSLKFEITYAQRMKRRLDLCKAN